MSFSEKDLTAALHVLLEEQVKKIADEELKKAYGEIERRMKMKVGEIVTTISSKTSFERFGPDLRITVHFPQNAQTN